MSRAYLESLEILNRLLGSLGAAQKDSLGRLRAGEYDRVVTETSRRLGLSRYDRELVRDVYGPQALEQHRFQRRWRDTDRIEPGRPPINPQPPATRTPCDTYTAVVRIDFDDGGSNPRGIVYERQFDNLPTPADVRDAALDDIESGIEVTSPHGEFVQADRSAVVNTSAFQVWRNPGGNRDECERIA